MSLMTDVFKALLKIYRHFKLPEVSPLYILLIISARLILKSSGLITKTLTSKTVYIEPSYKCIYIKMFYVASMAHNPTISYNLLL